MTPLEIREIGFSGSSDDNFQIDGAIRDEVGCYDDVVILEVKDPAGQVLNVVGEYGRRNKGMWMIGLQVPDDNSRWPNWKMSWDVAKSGYSPMLHMEVSVGTVITQLWPEPEVCGECERPHDRQKWTVR